MGVASNGMIFIPISKKIYQVIGGGGKQKHPWKQQFTFPYKIRKRWAKNYMYETTRAVPLCPPIQKSSTFLHSQKH
jgi:hypothetical protein